MRNRHTKSGGIALHATIIFASIFIILATSNVRILEGAAPAWMVFPAVISIFAFISSVELLFRKRRD